MGKIKHKKHIFHVSAPKANNDEYKLPELEEPAKDLPVLKFEGNFAPKCNIFQNVSIPSHALKQKLSTCPAKDEKNFKVTEVISNEEFKEYMLAKERNPRHPMRKKFSFDFVVASAKEFLKKLQKEKRKKKYGVLGNFQAMEDALPTLQQLVKESKMANEDDKPRASKSFAKKDADMMEDIQSYHQILNDSQYTSDPFGTISAQLKKKLQAECL